MNPGPEAIPPHSRETSPPDLTGSPNPPARLVPGPVADIPGYRLESVLGEGGMGVVYLARQERPDRLVALKLLRADLTVPRLLRRFEHEAEILGRLQHPGIAQIYEAGTYPSPTGPRPFFAMEYVRGAELISYATRNRLDVRARVVLMAAICEAVHHAHQQGVIHRDLKPGNILVDAQGQPKVLDFGVARLADPNQTARSMATERGQLVGTVPYMSPEQVGAADPADIDTRSDVYTLGVILHELLADELPYDFGKTSLPEMARIIREDPPIRLSRRDAGLAGDLETIAAKAMEKDRARRYASAAALAADLERYLRDEPVLARPASTWYQFRKFAKRRRALVAGAAGTLLALVIGILGTGYGLIEARRQRDEARAATQRETTQREIAEAVNAFLNSDLLGAVAPAASDAAGRGKDVLMRAVLDEASKRLDQAGAPGGRFADKPLVEAAVRVQLTNTYAALGDMETARGHAERALTLRRRQVGPDHPATLEAGGNLAVVYEQLGRFADAERLNRENLAAMERVHPPDHPDLINVCNNLGSSIQSQGRYADAEPFYRRCVEMATRKYGDDHPETLFFVCNLGGLLSELSRDGEAETLLRAAMLGFKKTKGADDPDTLWAMGRLANTLTVLGKNEEAEKFYREALESRRRVLGPEHPDTLTTLNNFGWWLGQQNRDAEAAEIHRECAELRSKTLGPDHPGVLASRNNLGSALQKLGRSEEAEAIYRDTLARRLATLGPDHPDTLSSLNNLGTLCRDAKRDVEAEAFFRQALTGYRAALGDQHLTTATVKLNLAASLVKLGRAAEARPLIDEGLRARRAALAPDHPDVRKAEEMQREAGE